MRFLILAVFILASCSNPAHIEGLSGGSIEGFRVHDTIDGIYGQTYKGSYEGLPMKVSVEEITGYEVGEKLIKDKRIQLNTLYRKIDSPYPGMISNSISCDEGFKPFEIDGLTVAFTGDRLNYGVCLWENIKYKSITRYIICEDKLFIVELFIEKEGEIEDHIGLMKVIDCE